MTDLTSLPDDLVTPVQSGEISVADLSRYIEKDYYPREAEVKKKFSRLNLEALERIHSDLLELFYVTAKFSEESEKISEVITKLNGEEYTKQLESARLVAWRSSMSKDYSLIKGIQTLLAEHQQKNNLRPGELTDCNNLEEMRAKIDLYRRLSRDRLEEFYNGQLKLFPIKSYDLSMSCGFWENTGGIDLAIMADDKYLVHVGGKIHRGLTQILTIQGDKEVTERIKEFREELGIHPANLTLLLFLKMGQYVGHENISIRGSASHAYNYTHKNSAFYNIPRDYFRLRVNPTSGLYEFDGKKRDQLLIKFAEKSPVIAQVFEQLDGYLN